MLPDEIWDFAERLRAEAVPVVVDSRNATSDLHDLADRIVKA